MKVSVIIPTYNRDKCLIDLLNCLFKQDYPDFEILVIDQSEKITAEKEEIINRNLRFLKYIQISERGRSLAKNYGILKATGDIVIFCDDDIRVPDNFISTHVRTFDDPRIAAVSCRLVEHGQPAVKIRRPLRTTFYGQLINKPYSTQSGFVTSLNGGNMSFRKTILDKVGFFEEYFVGTSMVEEPDMAYRILQAGKRLYFNASITVNHFPQYNGNIAELRSKTADWFYHYFVNICIFYLKYNRRANMPFVFFYCIALSFKHTIRNRLGFAAYRRMVAGYFDGLKRGREIWKVRPRGSKYFTPQRFNKTGYDGLPS